jgi:hypothetical protein
MFFYPLKQPMLLKVATQTFSSVEVFHTFVLIFYLSTPYQTQRV